MKGKEWRERELKPGGLGRTSGCKLGEKQFQIQKCVVKTIQDEKRVVGERQSGTIGIKCEFMSAILICYRQGLSYCSIVCLFYISLSVCLCYFNCFGFVRAMTCLQIAGPWEY